jgi:hypothetical protein
LSCAVRSKKRQRRSPWCSYSIGSTHEGSTSPSLLRMGRKSAEKDRRVISVLQTSPPPDHLTPAASIGLSPSPALPRSRRRRKQYAACRPRRHARPCGGKRRAPSESARSRSSRSGRGRGRRRRRTVGRGAGPEPGAICKLGSYI